MATDTNEHRTSDIGSTTIDNSGAMGSGASSVKRPRNTSSIPRRKGSKKENRKSTSSEGKHNLLNLPPEVRGIILHELLSMTQPIEFVGEDDWDWERRVRYSPPRLLWPEILRACKMLYEEGAEMLYSNTIECRVGIPWGPGMPTLYSARMKILSTHFKLWEEPNVDNRLASVLERVQKVNIDILADCGCKITPLEDDFSDCLDMGIRLITKMLRKYPNWIQVTVNLVTCHPADHNGLLNPFRYLRNRDAVIIEGVHPDYATSLSHLMESTNQSSILT